MNFIYKFVVLYLIDSAYAMDGNRSFSVFYYIIFFDATNTASDSDK